MGEEAGRALTTVPARLQMAAQVCDDHVAWKHSFVHRRLLSRAVVALCIRGLVVAFVLFGPAASAQLLLVVSDGAPAYGEVADEVRNRVAASAPGLRIDVVHVAEAATFDDRRLGSYRLVVTVGLAAARSVVPLAQASGARPPLLALLVPRAGYEELAAAGGATKARMSAIFIEQPLARQLDLVALALPGKVRVGVLLGPTSIALDGELAEQARARGLQIRRAEARDAGTVYSALRDVLLGSDILLALPDAVAINAATIRGVLVASNRAQVPVLGFSQALVDAGALLAVYTTPQQYARHAAEIATQSLAQHAPLPRAQYPRYFTVGVNFFAARALGLAVENETTLAAELAARDRARDNDHPQTSSLAPDHAGASRP